MNPIKIPSGNDLIEDLFVIQPMAFKDHRGTNFEGYNVPVYNNLIQRKLTFSVDSYSRSVKNVIRGLHGDIANWKLIDVLLGKIFFVAIDMRKYSSTYKRINQFTLSDENRWQILLPPGCINGHCVLSDECLFHYKLSNGFVQQSDQISFKWNDPQFTIDWPVAIPILSERDA